MDVGIEMRKKEMTAAPEVLVSYTGQVATITLNRGSESNPIGWTLGGNVLRALDEVESNRAVGAVILTGAGKSFCAGAKMGEMASLEPNDSEEQQDAFRDMISVVRRIRNHDLPFICALNGAAVGGGIALAMACDLVVASDNAYYFFAFGRLAIPGADLGCTYMLPRLVGPMRARHILYTGAKVPAQEGQTYGLFIDVCRPENLMNAAEKLAKEILSAGPRRSAAATKQCLFRGETTDFDACLFYERYVQGYFLNSREHKERLGAFLADQTARRNG
jgi:enoyl-CoA hydratase/carnithine racemase